MLYERGIEPGIPLPALARHVGIDCSDIKEHNALDDARLLKRLYEKIISGSLSSLPYTFK